MGADVSKAENNGKENYIIYDYRAPVTTAASQNGGDFDDDDGDFDSSSRPRHWSTQDGERWLRLVRRLCSDYVIVARRVVKTPLQTLKKLGPKVKGISFGENYGLFHAFIVFDLRRRPRVVASSNTSLGNDSGYRSSNADDRSSSSSILDPAYNEAVDRLSVSFERGQGGILFQIGRTVKDEAALFREGHRRDRVKILDSSVDLGFEGLLVDNLMRVDRILRTIEGLELGYSLKDRNCQHLRSEFQRRIVGLSRRVELNVPCSDRKVTLDRTEELLSFVEFLYPKWLRNETQSIPAIADRFAMISRKNVAASTEDSTLRRKEEASYRRSAAKEKCLEALEEVLKEADFADVRKCVMTKLGRNRFERALEVSSLEENLPKIISDFWSGFFDIFVIVENVGAVVVDFQFDEMEEEEEEGEKEEEEENDEDDVNDGNDAIESKYASRDASIKMISKMELLCRVEKLPNSGKCLHAISIRLGKETTIVHPLETREGGSQLEVDLSEDTLNDETKLESTFYRCLSDLKAATHEKTIPIQNLRNLAAKMIVLQNLEDESFLIHKKLEDQRWGEDGAVMLTLEQHRVLTDAREAFDGDEARHMLVTGCQGSGKTLLLMRLVREFHARHPTKKFAVRWFGSHRRLAREIGEHLRDNYDEDLFRVANSLREASLVLVDEVQLTGLQMDERRQLFFKSLNFQKSHVVLFSSVDNKAFSVNASMRHIGIGAKFKGYRLKGNLRSSANVTGTLIRIQEFPAVDNFIKNIPVEKAIEMRGPEPKIEIVRDESQSRDEFLQKCLDMFGLMTRSHEKGETILLACFMHDSLVRRLETSVKDKFPHLAEQFVITFREEVLGCQFSKTLLLMDVYACGMTAKLVGDCISRCTVSLAIVANLAKSMPTVNGISCWSERVTTPKSVVGDIQSIRYELTSRLGQKQIFVLDSENRISDEDRETINASDSHGGGGAAAEAGGGGREEEEAAELEEVKTMTVVGEVREGNDGVMAGASRKDVSVGGAAAAEEEVRQRAKIDQVAEKGVPRPIFDFTRLSSGYVTNAELLEATSDAALLIHVSTGNRSQMRSLPFSYGVNDVESIQRVLRWRKKDEEESEQNQIPMGNKRASDVDAECMKPYRSPENLVDAMNAVCGYQRFERGKYFDDEDNNNDDDVVERASSDMCVTVATGVREISLLTSAPYLHLLVVGEESQTETIDKLFPRNQQNIIDFLEKIAAET